MQRGTADDVKISGTGPYIVQSLTPTEIVLTKNPAYWGGRVKTDKVIVRSIPDGDTLTMALQNGEIDATQGLPYASLPLFTGNAKFKVASANTSRVFQACLNFTTPVLQEPAVRKAIAMAIDKDKFTSVLLNGNGTPAVGPFPPNMPCGGDAVHTDAYNAEQAKNCCGKPAGPTLTATATLIKTVRTLPSAGSPILPGRSCLCWPKRPRLF